MRLNPEYFGGSSDDEQPKKKKPIQEVAGLSSLPPEVYERVQLHARKVCQMISEDGAEFHKTDIKGTELVLGFQSYQVEVLQQATVKLQESVQYLAKSLDRLEDAFISGGKENTEEDDNVF